MPKHLVIVESPAKTKKIASFLGPGYQVLATMGHIRALDEDLNAIGLERDFEPKYRFLSEKSKATKPILEAAKDADTIYLAADDDREGEAIAYSVACLLKRDPLSLPRAVFHEITSKAVKEAIANPRRIDMNRVNAQQARAILDMMVGFTISPVLWKHVGRALSAGRCQTPALRLVSDREKTIREHTSTTSWNISGEFIAEDIEFRFNSKMDDDLEDQESVLNYMENVHTSNKAKISSVSLKPWLLNPPKPLITSTLQQEASALYSLNPKNTMSIAQKLYEAGHITYMRTDHAILSEEAIMAAQKYVRENHGERYIGLLQKDEKEKDKKKKKTESNKKDNTAQEAHECIRPTHFEVSELSSDWTSQEQKLYRLIWRRAVQAIMAPATGKTRTINIKLDADTDGFDWSTNWKTTEFDGWQILGKVANLDGSDEEESKPEEKAKQLKEGMFLKWNTLSAAPKTSRPPPRFTEATLIRELEQKGIGRPSTFASLVEVLLEKKYVEKQDIPGTKVSHTTLTLKPSEWPPSTVSKQIPQGAEKQKLVPTQLGQSVIEFCVKEFPQLFAYDFTSQMESRLDSVSRGEEEWKELCRHTWASYKDDYERLLKSNTIRDNSTNKEKDFGGGLKAIISKSGPLLLIEEPDSTKKSPKVTFYPFPEGYTLQTITDTIAREHIEDIKADTHIGVFNGKEIQKKKGPFGEYVQCGDIRIPYTNGESLVSIIEKLKERQETLSANVKVGPYIFSVGQYGPYMYKDGLKTRMFVSVPSTVDPKKLTVQQAEDLYKKMLEVKKQNATKQNVKRGGKTNSSFRGARANAKANQPNESTDVSS